MTSPGPPLARLGLRSHRRTTDDYADNLGEIAGGCWQAYEQSAVFRQEMQPILQPFFVGEYTTYRCDVKYEQ